MLRTIKRSGALLLILFGPLAFAGPAYAQEDPRVAEARERQARGRALLEASDPNGALVEFERVYALLEGHPRRYLVLSNIGRCHQALGQYDRALHYYERYVAEGGPAAEGRAEVEAAARGLLGLLGTVTITTNVAGAEVWIGSRRVGTAPGSVRVPGGRHGIELRAPGHVPARRELEIVARETVSIALELEPLGGVEPAFFWSGLALTLATGGAAAGLGGAFWAAHGDNEARRATMTLAPEDLGAERDLAIASDVLLATAGALAIATVVLALLTRWDEPARAESAWIDLQIAPEHLALELSGAF